MLSSNAVQQKEGKHILKTTARDWRGHLLDVIELIMKTLVFKPSLTPGELKTFTAMGVLNVPNHSSIC